MNVRRLIICFLPILIASVIIHIVLHEHVTLQKRDITSSFQRVVTKSQSEPNVTKTKMMNILLWVKKTDVRYGNLNSKTCKPLNCNFVTDRNNVDKINWDAIVLDTWQVGLYKALKYKRNPKTYWVYYTDEPPHHSNILTPRDKYKGIEFNLTMTFRTDSNFNTPYFRVVKREAPLKTTNLINIAAEKTGKIAWIVSNCVPKSQRDILVNSIQKFIPVDIFGRCGRTGERCGDNCMKKVAKNYKFYLSFENELCVDYITEKLSNPYENNVIPVVYGLGYENLNLPPHSYIDVFDFPNVKKLTDYLNYLDRNDTAYNEYFKWRNNYYIHINHRRKITDCQLCEFLHKANDFNSKASEKENLIENIIPTIPAKDFPLKINMPKPEDIMNNIEIHGSNIRVRNISKWMNSACLNTKKDENLFNFISGN